MYQCIHCPLVYHKCHELALLVCRANVRFVNILILPTYANNNTVCSSQPVVVTTMTKVFFYLETCSFWFRTKMSTNSPPLAASELRRQCLRRYRVGLRFFHTSTTPLFCLPAAVWILTARASVTWIVMLLQSGPGSGGTQQTKSWNQGLLVN
jgi:hypothetical protein